MIEESAIELIRAVYIHPLEEVFEVKGAQNAPVAVQNP